MKTLTNISIVFVVCSWVSVSAWGSQTVGGSSYCQVAGSACLEFDGIDDYVDLGNDASLALSPSGMTVSAWVCLGDNTSGKRMGILGKMARGTYRGFSLTREDNNKIMFLRGNGTFKVLHGVQSDGVYTQEEWVHVAGVRRGGTSYLYINGVRQQDTDTTSFLDSGEIAHVGRYYGNSGIRPFDGMIDDVRFYSRGLSSTEINSMKSTFPVGEPALAGYWNFNEGTGQTAHDSSGNNNHGRLGVDPSADASDPKWVNTNLFCPAPPAGPRIWGYVRDAGLNGIQGVTVSGNNGGGVAVTIR